MSSARVLFLRKQGVVRGCAINPPARARHCGAKTIKYFA